MADHKKIKAEVVERELTPAELEIKAIKDEAKAKVDAIKAKSKEGDIVRKIDVAIDQLTRLKADPMNVTGISVFVRTAGDKIAHSISSVL